MKVMGRAGHSGATSFHEDYTYHLDPTVIGARRRTAEILFHPLRRDKPSFSEFQHLLDPLGIGRQGRSGAACFSTAPPGPAINASADPISATVPLCLRVPTKSISLPPPAAPLRETTRRPPPLWNCRPDFKTALRRLDSCRRRASHRGSAIRHAEHIKDFAEIARI